MSNRTCGNEEREKMPQKLGRLEFDPTGYQGGGNIQSPHLAISDFQYWDDPVYCCIIIIQECLGHGKLMRSMLRSFFHSCLTRAVGKHD